MSAERAIAWIWIAWAASWFAAAIFASRAERGAGFRRQLAYRVVMVLGAFALATRAPKLDAATRLWALPDAAGWALAGGVVVGVAFAWWARLHLGRLWSGRITKKADHHVVDTGPYRLVRHPIYTGLLFGIYATAIAKGTALALAGAAILTLGVWMKARLEESFLREELGADAYDAYRARVPMLVPFTKG